MMTQGWADAVVSHPHSVVELTRLIAEPPAETSAPSSPEGRPTPGADSQPRSDPGRTAVATAPPTAPRHSPPLDDAVVSRMRSISEEERGRRLIQAAKLGMEEELQVLLAAGANVRVRDENWSGWTALHWAAQWGHVEAVRRLVQGGAELDARDNCQSTPMHLAAFSGHATVVKMLAASSADPNARNQWGATPLHCAAYCGYADVAAALLEVGANRVAREIMGWTALDLARLNKHEHLEKMLI
ncbi:poly [ADP-ribose] polymerase tankyrase-1-like [Schistocerca nitens]|uniref:poly [ADP-ribose] polymerase tankyrase-1-like n=1 Tax=Schistocerca nitens TaxID=7011 RepID=UPI0021185FA1|nr:poly [ADP-ribose] polymerase tankyrase-1-like [Schistocerca nitens]